MAKPKYYSEIIPCTACGRVPVALHHENTQGSGGTDDDWNLLPLCAEHHTEIHKKGSRFMAAKYPQIRGWYIQNNWFICELTGKYRHG
jgi:hypothetical protein